MSVKAEVDDPDGKDANNFRQSPAIGDDDEEDAADNNHIRDTRHAGNDEHPNDDDDETDGTLRRNDSGNASNKKTPVFMAVGLGSLLLLIAAAVAVALIVVEQRRDRDDGESLQNQLQQVSADFDNHTNTTNATNPPPSMAPKSVAKVPPSTGQPTTFLISSFGPTEAPTTASKTSSPTRSTNASSSELPTSAHLPTMTMTASPTVGATPGSDQMCVRVELQLDDYPRETGWSISGSSRDGSARNVSAIVRKAPFGTYTEPNALVLEKVFVDSGRYYFFDIKDQFGDGLCCSSRYGRGSFHLYLQSEGMDDALLATDSNGSPFEGHGMTARFYVPYQRTVEPTHQPTDSLSPSMMPTTVMPTTPPSRPPTRQSVPWDIVHKVGSLSYFLFSFPPRLERYSVESLSFLPALTLSSVRGIPTAFGADEQHLFLAYDRAAYRYDLDGSNEVFMLSAEERIREFHSDGGLIFVHFGKSWMSVWRESNAVHGFFEMWRDLRPGTAIARQKDRIIGQTGGALASVQYSGTTGDILGSSESPRQQGYPAASKVWIFLDETHVIDNSGNVYAAATLAHLNAIGSGIYDLDWRRKDDGENHDDELVVLDMDRVKLTAYSSQSLLPMTSYKLMDVAPRHIRVSTDMGSVLAFTPDETATPQGIRVDVVPLTLLQPPAPGVPMDPTGLSFTPTSVFVDNDGMVNLFSSTLASIFRWDPLVQIYRSTIPLQEMPKFAAFSSENNRVYTVGDDGLIRQIDMFGVKKGSWREEPFFALSGGVLGLATAGRFVFAADTIGAWGSHYTFDPNGTRISAVEWNYYSEEYVWNEANRKIYFFRDGVSPNDILWEEIGEDGRIGAQMDSPDHSSKGIRHPIRVKPDGSIVVLGSGVIRNAQTLEKLATSLPHEIVDAAFVADGSLRTIRNFGNDDDANLQMAQIQEWKQEASLPLGKVVEISGSAYRLVSTSQNLLIAIVLVDSIPEFVVLDEALHVVNATGSITVFSRQDT